MEGMEELNLIVYYSDLIDWGTADVFVGMLKTGTVDVIHRTKFGVRVKIFK